MGGTIRATNSNRTKTLKVACSQETKDAFDYWRESYGLPYMSDLFALLAKAVVEGRIMVLPSIGYDQIAEANREEIERIAGRRARKEVIEVLYEEGFLSSTTPRPT